MKPTPDSRLPISVRFIKYVAEPVRFGLNKTTGIHGDSTKEQQKQIQSGLKEARLSMKTWRKFIYEKNMSNMQFL